MRRLILLPFCVCAAAAETRYSVSVANEALAVAGLRVPGTNKGNLLIVQPALSYRSGHIRFTSKLAGLTRQQGGTQASLRVRETYAGLTAGDFDFTAGKRLLRWGAGYAFTATGILDPPRTATDPIDRLNLNEGREMVTADWVRGKHDLTFAFASSGTFRRQANLRDTAALRYNLMVAGFDTAVMVARERGGAAFSGANFTRVFGDSAGVHGEFAMRQDAELLLGGKYTPAPNWHFIGEYYTTATAGRQHYSFLRASKSRIRELPGWKQWDVAGSVVCNLGDGSRILVLDVTRRFGDHTSGYARAQFPGGRRGASEFGMIPYTGLMLVGVSFQL